MIFASAIVFLSALVASATDFNVTVGANNQLIFDPTSVTVQNGDTVHFEFVSKNHSVTQSTFATPCSQVDGGIDSGTLSVSDPKVHPVWSFTVNDASTPFWFYCGQKTPANHCQMGMVFAVNPTADKSFDAFQAAAKNSANSTTGGASAPPTPLGTAFSANALTVASSAIPSSAGPEVSTPSGSGFSTSGIEPTGAISSTASNQDANGAVTIRNPGATSVVTVVSLIAAVASFMV